MRGLVSSLRALGAVARRPGTPGASGGIDGGARRGPGATSGRGLRSLLPRAVWLAGVSGFTLLVPHVALLVVPGLCFLPQRGGRKTLLDMAATAHVVSLVFWVVLFLQLKWIPLPLSVVTRAVLAGSLAVLGIRTFARRRPGRLCAVPMSVVLLGVPLVMRLWPLLVSPVPLGPDIVVPCVMARLVAEADGYPASCEPLLPVSRFGLFVPGFASVTAQMADLAGRPVWTAIWHLSLIGFVTYWLALYLLLRVRFSPVVSWAAAGAASLLGTVPSIYLRDGQGATVMSWALLAFGTALVLRGGGRLVGAGLSFLAAWAMHPIPPVILGYLLGLLVPFGVLLGWRPRVRWIVLGAVAALVLSLPVLEALTVVERTQGESESARMWAAMGGLGPPTKLGTLLLRLWRLQLRKVGAVLLALSALGLVAGCSRSARETCVAGLGALGAFALPLLLYVKSLPLSYLMYGDRVPAMLLFPGAWLLASLGDGAARALRRLPLRAVARARAAARWGVVVALCAGALPTLMTIYEWRTWRYFTAEEEQFFRWVAQHTTRSDLIWADGHGGSWIPVIAFRTTANPHGNPMFNDEVRKAFPWSKVTHLYHHDVMVRRLSRRSLEEAPFVEELHRRGDLAFYRVLDGEALRDLIVAERKKDPSGGARPDVRDRGS